MDPISAFSVAGTILQFVDSGFRFVALARKLHQHGSDDTDNHVHLLGITKDLGAILADLKCEDAAHYEEQSFRQLALDCGKTAAQLLTIVQQVHNTRKTRKRDALKAAFQLLYKKDEIKALQDRLSSYRDQLNLHLLLSLRKHASKAVEQQEATLKNLGVVHDQTLSVGGIAASILEYLASRRKEDQDRDKAIGSLKQDLLHTCMISEPGSNGIGPDANYINLSPLNRERAESLFIASIQYDGMVDRKHRITKAHESTFRWVFREDQLSDDELPTCTWSDLRAWLESSEQLYWITGKAGSGKSTLIKFLCSSPDRRCSSNRNKVTERSRCYPYLKRWSQPLKLVTASFYFWNSGMEIQTTRAGPLRTLLSQIVEQRPEIIPTLAPKYWESLCLFDQSLSQLWPTNSLYDMLFQALEMLSIDSKICIFIDGLDEFGDNHDELISMVKHLTANSGHVKVCVASRPWNVFQDSLGNSPSMRLEDLTSHDIKYFVQSKFRADTEFEKLRRRSPSFANQLVDNIVVKASGVFLWVDLVVASLLAGMRLGDRIQDFQRRLDDLPPDLEKLYEKILDSLDPFYLEHAAQYFNLVETAKRPLTILQFSFADEESPESALEMPCGSMTEDMISLRVDAMHRRLNSRCKGFLETDRVFQSVEKNNIGGPSWLTVQYLHRTVKDFIKSPKAQRVLESSTDLRSDASLQLCIAYLMDIKTRRRGPTPEDQHSVDRYEESLLAPKVVHCLRRAACVSKSSERPMIQLLDELKKVVGRPGSKQALSVVLSEYQRLHDDTLWRPHIKTVLRTGPGFFQTNSSLQEAKTWDLDVCTRLPIDKPFLSLIVRHGVVAYVRDKVVPTSSSSRQLLLLLFMALSLDVPEPAMIECLLDLGGSPNARISKTDNRTPWTVALTKVSLLLTIECMVGTSAEYAMAEEKWKQIIRLMFLKGADHMRTPESLLTPISSRFLREVRSEVEPKSRAIVDLGAIPGISSWLGAWSGRRTSAKKVRSRNEPVTLEPSEPKDKRSDFEMAKSELERPGELPGELPED